MYIRSKYLLFICLFALVSFASKAEIKLPSFFSDGMVLQQEMDVPVWGTAKSGSKITISTSWDNNKKIVETDSKGNWKVYVKTPSAGGPYSISLSEDNGSPVVVEDVLIGEVWLCSGQSNMEMPMKGYKNQPVDNSNMDILKSKNNNIRLFTVKRNSSIDTKSDVKGEWDMATPASVKEFSALGYYYGKLLNEVLDVPVGLICSSWGGSWIESWMDKEMLVKFSDVKLPKDDSDIKEKNRTPTTLYNAMIAPLVGYGMRGVIWYQGESNYDKHESYLELFKTMVSEWRSRWGQGEFPFYYCQIAPYDYALVTKEDDEVVNSAYLREAQMKAEFEIPNSGMAVLMDAGSEKCIHPSQKNVAAERLAFQALGKTYGIEGITADSPVFKDMTIEGDTIVLSFDRADMWISSQNDNFTNFVVAGDDRQFHKAEAWISRSKVYVKSEFVKNPVALRYAFTNYAHGDLFGTSGLPVSSFRTDNW